MFLVLGLAGIFRIVLANGSLLVMITHKLYVHVLPLIHSFSDLNLWFPCVKHLEFILAKPTELTFKVFLKGLPNTSEGALGKSEKRHLNFFLFDESVMNTGPVHCSKAYIVKFQFDFSKWSELVPFLSKLLKFHLLILKLFFPRFHFFLQFQ
jgi:hypothetical protein